MDRRAAAVATAVTIPVVVLLAFVLSSGRSTPSSSVPSGSAPAAQAAITTVPAGLSDDATVAACTKVLSVLPVQLDKLAPRTVFTVRAVAWGSPPVILRCGVPRPPELVVGSTASTFGLGTKQVFWLFDDPTKPTRATVIDRAVYIEVTGDLTHLATLSDAIASALPAVCVVDDTDTVAVTRLCTHRK